jgi:hypothetical protein
MPNNLKFPCSVEIKRAIAAAIKAGIEIGLVEIHADKIMIHPRHPIESELGEYDLWKMSLGEDTRHVRHVDKQSDALPKKPRG